MPSYAPQSNLTIDVQYIGASREPVLIIDDFLTNADALVAAAVQSPAWANLPPGGYPGRRAPLPGEYVRAMLRRLDAPIRQRLLGRDLQLSRFECAFSMVTCAPSDLTPLQRVPHIDIADENRVAILHYLCDGRFGGTAFFRQAETGLEQVRPADKARYLSARAAEVASLGEHDAYPGASTPGYECIGTVSARFNRLVAYRSMTLHSGIIDDPSILSANPAEGRLTANAFVDYRAKTPGDGPRH